MNDPSDQSEWRLRGDDDPKPKHPTKQAALLLVAVTLLIFALAALSSYGRL